MMLTLLEEANTVSMHSDHPAMIHPKQPPWLGLLVVLSIALGAAALIFGVSWLPEPWGSIPISTMLVAIVAGIAVGPKVRARKRLKPGIDLAKGPLLKLAVALVGLRLSLHDLLVTGTQALPLVIGMIVLGISLVLLLGRLFNVSPRLTILLAAGTSICGASAIAATSPALRAHHEETCYAIATIGILGLIAILVYPLILQQALVDPQQIGLALGTVVHDTAQVMAAAVYHQQLWPNDQTLDAATVSKLMRNSTMLIVIPALVIFHRRWDRPHDGSDADPVAFPYFILAFLGLSIFRTIGDAWFGSSSSPMTGELWSAFLTFAHQASLFGFSMAMSALATTVSLAELKALGIRGFAVGAIATWTMLGVALLWLN